jgi:hypothetical protein
LYLPRSSPFRMNNRRSLSTRKTKT